jgi:undecaprenyl diphosphate synthase
MPAVLPMRSSSSSSAAFSKTEADLFNQIDPARLPVHIAIIMDGNGRWAKKRHMPRVLGHRAGVETVRHIVRAAGALGIKVLTLYAFSSENWSRPTTEIKALMLLLEEFLEKELPELRENRVQLRAIGRLGALSSGALQKLEHVIQETKDHDGLILNLALNYGGRQEIVDACNRAWKDGVHEIDEKTLARYLYSPSCPDPDLLIRTSGEMRLSNFLLWEMAYTEFHITPVLWPEFRRQHLFEAVLDYQKRERRYGGL